jgi:hypothetical protein
MVAGSELNAALRVQISDRSRLGRTQLHAFGSRHRQPGPNFLGGDLSFGPGCKGLGSALPLFDPEPRHEVDRLRIDIAPIDPDIMGHQNFANALSFAADVERTLSRQGSFHGRISLFVGVDSIDRGTTWARQN